MSRDNPKSKAEAGNGSGTSSPKHEPSAAKNTTGRVKFDDRGNAVWEWAVSTGAFGTEVSTSRLKKLENPTLSLADDSPPPVEIAKTNPQGVRHGYSPYDSGLLVKQPAPAGAKKDLRRLGEWLKLRKQSKPEDG